MTEDQIYSEMLAAFQEKTGYEMNGTADLAVRLRAAAAQIMSLYNYGDYIYRQAFPQTAVETALDRHGVLRGVPRVEAERAKGKLTFSISSMLDTRLMVPQGTVCMTADAVAFETLEEGRISSGFTSVTVEAQAMEIGTAGNVAAGTVTVMQTPPDGIEMVTNAAPFSGGSEREDDETYRVRVLQAYNAMNNGVNGPFYRNLALSIPGIDRAWVIRCPEGAGTVGLLVASDTGTVSDEAISQLKALLIEREELGIQVSVSRPESVEVSVTGKVLPAAGYTLGEAMEKVRPAIAGCFYGDSMGKTLYLSQLVHAAMETGAIDNIVLTAPTEDLVMAQNQQPVLSALTLEGM